jgi:hypothetical protein
VIGQQVARGGEMLWFHSVTVGGSVKKLISYSLESCELFFKRQIEKKNANFTLSFYERKLIFVKQNGQF